MEKIVFCFLSILLVFSYKKKEPLAPDPYTYDAEIQSSQDIYFASDVIS